MEAASQMGKVNAPLRCEVQNPIGNSSAVYVGDVSYKVKDDFIEVKEEN